MRHTVDSLTKVVHKQAADLAVKGLLISALLQQAPNKAKLIHDFGEMAEDHAVRAMNSSMPEEFFQEFQNLRSIWVSLLEQVAAAR